MKNKSYIILKDKLTLKQASDLLSEELMLRYRLPANGTDNHYLVTAHWDYNETQNKDYFKPTKVSAVPLTEQEIRDTNPWQSSYVRPNPSALYDPDAEWLLTCDEQIIKEFNQKNKNTDYKFMLGMRPEIFNGNPLKSKVVILSLNPGYVYRVNNLYARLLQMVQPIEEAVKQHKDNQLKLSASSFFCQRNQTNDGGMISYRDAHCAVDDWYWYDIFKEFRKKAGLPDENDMNDVIFNNVSLVQYVGYISKSWKSLHKLLPSQRFTRMLIHYLALNTDTLFVVSRSEKLWKRLIGDEIWEMLDNDKRLVHRKKFENKKGITQAIRTQGFTKASFEDGGFDRIADKFRT